MGRRIKESTVDGSLKGFLKIFEGQSDDANIPLDPVYKKPPVSFIEFIESKHFLDIKKSTYSYWKEFGRKLFTPAKGGGYLDFLYRDAVAECGIGSGKSWAAVYFGNYLCYLLCCLPNPIAFLRYQRGDTITFLNMSKSETHAKEQYFDRMIEMFKQAPYWKRYANHVGEIDIQKLSIDIPDKKVKFICGNSKSSKALGFNIFYAFLDECNFYEAVGGQSTADETANNLSKRIVSRNKTKGLMFMASSNTDSNAFTTRQRRMARDKNLPRLLADNQPVWAIKEGGTSETFIFHYSGYDSWGEKKVEETWEIPIEYQSEFERDPERAAMDLGGRPSEKIGSFIKNWEAFNKIFVSEMIDPVRDRQEDMLYFHQWFKGDKHKIYHIHFDIGIVKDFCGIAMCHTEQIRSGPNIGDIEIVYDLVTYLRKNEWETELQFDSIHKLVYDLADLGFQMKLSFDGGLSKETIQRLKNRGFDVERQSVDTTREPYDNWHTLMLENKIKVYTPLMTVKRGMPPVNILEDEAKTLKVVKRGNGEKIDHVGPGSRKDAMDAMAGSAFRAISEPVAEITFDMWG